MQFKGVWPVILGCLQRAVWQNALCVVSPDYHALGDFVRSFTGSIVGHTEMF